MSYIICPYCGKEFHSLGIMRHRNSCQKQDNLTKGCGKSLNYRHLSGATAWCGDDIGTRIVYCKSCQKQEKK